MKVLVAGMRLAVFGIFLLLFPIFAVFAQTLSGTIRGQISDPSGASVGNSTVVAVSSAAQTKAGIVKADGTYEIRGLAPGKYTVKAEAKGFTPFEQADIQVAAGQVQKLDIALQIAEEREQITVSDQATKVGVSPDDNASATVIKGADLQALSDDPDELQSELEALAGPSAGPNGGQIYIDGFTGGQLPPKADILEIRVNQNPFSAEYDKLGYGRIEITTRPGASQFHGQVLGDISDSALNSRNPFVATQPAYHTDFFNGSIGGPLGKKASFFINAFRRNINDNSIVSAYVLGPTLAEIPFSQAVASPRTLTNVSPRFDYQLKSNNVLTARYQFFDNNSRNSGIGLLNLASQGFNSGSIEHTLQVSDTHVFSAKTLNQLRFQYLHDTINQTSQVLGVTISVLGAFTGGGNPLGKSGDTQNHYEVQNLTSFFLGKHTLVVGGRLRNTRDNSASNGNFNGTFSFPTLDAYQGAETALQACGNTCVVSGATQFSITTGQPLLSINVFDVGLFGQDDWKLQKNMTLSLGLRWESQNAIHDHSDFAPRVGLAWGLHHSKNGAASTVLRAGGGVFYDRFTESLVLQAERLNGVNQQQYIIPSPNFFPAIPSLGTLASLSTSLPSTYQIAPNLQAPYVIQSAVSIEQQVSKSATVSVTYLRSHGVHQLLTVDINAPLPGTFTLGNPGAGVRPFGNSAGNLYQYQSNGLFTQNQVITNLSLRLSTKLSLFGYYTLGYANGDTTGNSAGIAMNPYDLLESYGRAGFDVRNRVFLGGNWNLPRRISLSPFMSASSGAPFNVTVGQDLFGTGALSNSRPAFAAVGATGSDIKATSLGTFDILPSTDQALIPPNYFEGPGQLTLNLRLAKTFNFGKEMGKRANQGGGGGFGGGPDGGGGPRGGGGPGGGLGGRGLGGGGGGGRFGGGVNGTKRYNLTFSIYARNLLNNVNYGQPIGVIGSKFFGTSNSLGGLFGGGGGPGGGGGGSQSANRRLDFQISFSF